MLYEQTELFQSHADAACIPDSTIKEWTLNAIDRYRNTGDRQYSITSGDFFVEFFIHDHQQGYEEPKITIRVCKISEVCWMKPLHEVREWLKKGEK